MQQEGHLSRHNVSTPVAETWTEVPETRPWMKVPEAARYFRIPRSRMYDLIQKGELPAVRIGQRSIRVDLRECERVLAEKRRIYPGLT